MREDEYTGIEAQRDKEFGVSGKTEQYLSDIENLESELEQMDAFDEEELKTGLSDYDKFIVLPKRELLMFLRAVEPLTKSTVDQYGKSVQISCISSEQCELSYYNSPFRLVLKVPNKSKKVVDTFCINVSLLKRLVTEGYNSVAIVETEENGVREYSIAVCDSLLFLETVKLSESEYQYEKKELNHTIDRELGLYCFRKIGSILSTSDRSSEKVIVVKGKDCYFNTGVFSARVNSPFSEERDMLLIKSTVDLLGILMEISKVDIKYAKEGDRLYLLCDNLMYCETMVMDKIEDHFSPATARSLKFNATVSIVNDSMGRLFSYVRSLDYLSNIITVQFTKKEMSIILYNNNQTKKSKYDFLISEGTVEEEGEMKVSADVMKPYLDVTGTNVKYAFNEIGLCMSNEVGDFIIRKS